MNPFGEFAFDDLNPADNLENIDDDFFDILNLNEEEDIDAHSPTLVIPSSAFNYGRYYAFKLAVTYKGSGETNYGYVGVIVNLPIPYPKPSVTYIAIEEGSNVSLDVTDFYDFYSLEDVEEKYGIEWDCYTANTSDSVFVDASTYDGERNIVINEDNADLEVSCRYKV